jgi:two-component system, OmpR family, response regulator
LAIRILIVEDDIDIATRMAAGLRLLGFTVECVHDGEEAARFGLQEPFDAIILDLGLPTLPGIDVLKHWRQAGLLTPVLVITARVGWADKVDGLNAGADDYIGKPFHVPEIAARLRALMRRAVGQSPSVLLSHKDIAVDLAAGTATRAGDPIELTAQEFRLLTFLMHRVGRLVTQSELVDHLYGLDEERSSNTVEVYIGRLRRKIGRDTITTTRGLGYRFG